MIVVNPKMLTLKSQCQKIANSDAPVFITGESGTGKEVIATCIHQSGKRSVSPLLRVNCAALPKDLIESELFGSVKGAFTSSVADKQGLLRAAGMGTLLLDEISEMDIAFQAKLLRVIQDRKARPVGGTQEYEIQCRFMASSNIDPMEAIRRNKLRNDLYYRLSVIVLNIPPLRERKDEIPVMAKAFFEKACFMESKKLTIQPEALQALSKYEWLGNVRQLNNTVHRAVVLADDGIELGINNFDLPTESTSESSDGLTLMEQAERNKIVEVLTANKGNKLETSRALGIGRQTLYNKIKLYQIAA